MNYAWSKKLRADLLTWRLKAQLNTSNKVSYCLFTKYSIFLGVWHAKAKGREGGKSNFVEQSEIKFAGSEGMNEHKTRVQCLQID